MYVYELLSENASCVTYYNRIDSEARVLMST